MLFEFGEARQRKLQIREDIARWQPSVRTLLQVQITFAQYRLTRPSRDLPPAIHQADIGFEHDFAMAMRAMAGEVTGQPVNYQVPDMRASAAHVQQQIRDYYQSVGEPVSPRASDVMGLTESLASILVPLYEDIRSTFAAHSHGAAMRTELRQKEA